MTHFFIEILFSGHFVPERSIEVLIEQPITSVVL